MYDKRNDYENEQKMCEFDFLHSKIKCIKQRKEEPGNCESGLITIRFARDEECNICNDSYIEELLNEPDDFENNYYKIKKTQIICMLW